MNRKRKLIENFYLYKSEKEKIFIIAEVGSVHDGSLGNAINLIKVAKECGASAVKFQTHIADEETLKDALNPSYFQDENRYDYFQRTSFSINQLKKLKNYARKIGIKFFSSPFSIKALDLLNNLGVEYIKIPSGEVNNLPLLEKISKKNKIVFLSTGMSSWKEIDQAVKILKNNKLIIMQCTSMYPCPPNKVGINIFQEFRKKYNLQLGFSDHTQGNVAAIMALANGARYFEKHITLSKRMYGSDALNSLEPHEFKKYCENLKEALIIQNNPSKKSISKHLKNMKLIFEKNSIKKAYEKNSVLTLKSLGFKKTKKGINANQYKKIIGKKLKKDMKKDSIIESKNLYD